MAMLALLSVWMRLYQVESPLQERVEIVESDMARTFEFVLHFVGCDMVTVSLNQINNYY